MILLKVMEAKINSKVIAFTKSKLPYGWMGNMSPYPVSFMGKNWRTTEALFQALRFDDESIQELIRAEKSPMGAKLKAKSMADKMTVAQLSVQDIKNMELCVRLKIEQYPKLKQQLIDTGEAYIYEDVTKRGDKGSNLTWGAMLINETWIGENTLGEIWMKVRSELIENENHVRELFETVDLIKSGYAGILSNGNIVDRRKFPEAFLIHENPLFGCPKPKDI